MTVVKLAENIELEKQNVTELRGKANNRFDSLMARATALQSHTAAQAAALDELIVDLRHMKAVTDEELGNQHAALDAILGEA